MSDYFRQNARAKKISNFNSSWVFHSSLEESLKSKIEKTGKPLREWDIKIYRGILTGYNDAFIIDTNTRNRLIDISPKNDEIIRPILLGKNIKRYSYAWDEWWLINAHNGIKSKFLPKINLEENYPVIYDHLSQFKDKLTLRYDQGDH